MVFRSPSLKLLGLLPTQVKQVLDNKKLAKEDVQIFTPWDTVNMLQPDHTIHQDNLDSGVDIMNLDPNFVTDILQKFMPEFHREHIANCEDDPL